MKKMNNILKMISQMDANANEIKLAKHEVNLSTVQTIIDYSIKANKIVSDVDKLEAEFTTAEKRILDLRKQINSYKENAKISSDVLDGELEKLVKQSKELGIDFNSIPAYKQGKQAYGQINVIPKLIEEYNKPI
jgi:predicted  nucleic acid-binding Zn-ribbon protein